MAEVRRDVVWAAQARHDLIDIWKYFARVASPEIADKLLRDIKAAAERLREHPFSGRPRNEIASGLRSLLVHPHSIIYRVTETKVDIARILHERRDFAAAFTEDRKS
jgi:toxin ParE1/3/4